MKKIVRQLGDEICQKIKSQVIRGLQKEATGVLGEGILNSMWDEICVIIQEGDDEFYWECVDSIDGEIDLVLNKQIIPTWQLCALWIITQEGSEWLLGEKDKSPNEIYLTHNISDIRKHIREEYILDAATNWSNRRIERFQQRAYEMDEY